ncbi:MAG: hypothetical protein QN178_02155 [Armatimonadota bacterium]|nr:hypothetical protein [Armatimonadota bacterium]
MTVRRSRVKGVARRPDRRDATQGSLEWLFIERARVVEPVVVELDRPAAFRPKPTGFWRAKEFYVIKRIIATRREHDAVYHRVVTDRGAFDLRHVRRMDPRTLRVWRTWELCAHLDAMQVTRRPWP